MLAEEEELRETLLLHYGLDQYQGLASHIFALTADITLTLVSKTMRGRMTFVAPLVWAMSSLLGQADGFVVCAVDKGSLFRPLLRCPATAALRSGMPGCSLGSFSLKCSREFGPTTACPRLNRKANKTTVQGIARTPDSDNVLLCADSCDDDAVQTKRGNKKGLLWAPATSLISWREYRARLVKVHPISILLTL